MDQSIVANACKALVLCLLFGMMGSLQTVAYSDPPTSLDETLTAIGWFPVPANRQNDDAWEVQCADTPEGPLAQRFNETIEDTGNANFLDTVYGTDGSLTVTRNDAHGANGVYAPFIRTLLMESRPRLDMSKATTLHVDLEAVNTDWSLVLTFDDTLEIPLSAALYAACDGGIPLSPDAAAPAGRYSGSLDLHEVLTTLAASDSAYSTAAQTLLQTPTPMIPHLRIAVVGDVGASLTVRKLILGSPDDPQGDNAVFVDMGLLTGQWDIIYGGCFPVEDSEWMALSETVVTTAKTTNDADVTASPQSTDRTWLIVSVTGAAVIVLWIAVRKRRKE